MTDSHTWKEWQYKFEEESYVISYLQKVIRASSHLERMTVQIWDRRLDCFTEIVTDSNLEGMTVQIWGRKCSAQSGGRRGR